MDLVIQAQAQVYRISHSNRVSRNLIRPDIEVAQRGSAKNCGKSAVHRVLAAGKFYAPDPRHIETSVNSMPVSTKIDLRIRMEIHMPVRLRKTDIGQVPRHVTSRDVESSIQSDNQMRKVTTNPVSTLQYIPSRKICLP